MKTIFYIIFIALLSLILASCSFAPSKNLYDISMDKRLSAKEKQKLIIDIEDYINALKDSESWDEYIDYTTEQWSYLKPDGKIAMEYDIWKTLDKISVEDREEILIDYYDHANLVDWLEFVAITQQSFFTQKQPLKDSLAFNKTAIFNAHLSKHLIKKLSSPKHPKHLAVLLPFTGDYSQVSLQIRNGIIKNKIKNVPETTLSFYDSSNAEQIQNTYRIAINKGADFIIGPIKKEAIDNLFDAEDLDIDYDKILTLNKGLLPSFNYDSLSEGQQITKKLCDENYKNIAILTSNGTKDINLAVEITQKWQALPGKNVSLKAYPRKKPNFRKALGSITNANSSMARKNDIKWLLEEKIHFTPRTRQDLNAIVLIGSTKQLAVFKPQFKFFNLNIPVYGSAKLTPVKFCKTKPNRDLNNLTFPSYPAALIGSNLTSKLEAFGWDSLTIATSQHLFSPNSCLNSGMTGRLTKNGQEYDHKYIWARYNAGGYAEYEKEYIDTIIDLNKKFEDDMLNNKKFKGEVFEEELPEKELTEEKGKESLP